MVLHRQVTLALMKVGFTIEQIKAMPELEATAYMEDWVRLNNPEAEAAEKSVRRATRRLSDPVPKSMTSSPALVKKNEQ